MFCEILFFSQIVDIYLSNTNIVFIHQFNEWGPCISKLEFTTWVHEIGYRLFFLLATSICFFVLATFYMKIDSRLNQLVSLGNDYGLLKY